MKNMKKALNIGIIMVMALSCSCIFQNKCIAAENNANYSSSKENQKITDIAEYVNQARKQIKANWYPPVNAFENSATIVITIDRKGQLQKCHLSEPSPSEEFNNSLIEAAKKVKYSPLPYDYPYNTVDLDFQFGMQRRSISK